MTLDSMELRGESAGKETIKMGLKDKPDELTGEHTIYFQA